MTTCSPCPRLGETQEDPLRGLAQVPGVGGGVDQTSEAHLTRGSRGSPGSGMSCAERGPPPTDHRGSWGCGKGKGVREVPRDQKSACGREAARTEETLLSY